MNIQVYFILFYVTFPLFMCSPHILDRPSKRQKFYINRFLVEHNLRKNNVYNLSKFKLQENAFFNQICFNSTVFNIRLYKTAT